MEVPLPGFRFAADDAELAVRDGAGRILGRLVRLAPAGLAWVADGELPRVDERLRLVLDGRPLTARVVALRQLGGEGVVVAELPDATLETARAMASLVRRLMAFRAGLHDDDYTVAREQIRSPERIREIMRALFANRAGGRIRRLDRRDDGKGIRLTPSRLAVESDLPLQWEAEEPWFAPPFLIELDGYVSRFRFRVDEARNVDGFLAAPLPAELERLRSRHQRRAAAPADVKIVLRHPRWPELHIERPVRNLSLDGLAFTTSVFKDLLWPGLDLPDVTVVWQDRLVCRLRALVRHVSEDIDTASELCGLRIEFASDDDAIHWRQRLEGLLYPDTSADGTWSRPLWDLYRDSGYFNLSQKEEADFADLREPFARVGRVLASAPSLGCQVVWPSARGLEASISMLRIYRHGTFVYQLARRPGRAPRYPGRKILRDIYARAIEHIAENELQRWLIVWVQEEARFSRLVHHVLPARYADSGRAEILRFRAMEGRCDVAPAASGDFHIAPATASETAALVEAIARRHSRAFAEAHDLVAERIELHEIAREWQAAGLHRERQLLVAHARGRAVAAAVVELADEGLHLFALLDLVRLYPLVDGGEAAFVALLEAARAVYAARGKKRFVYFQEPRDAAATAAARLVDLGAADATLLPAELWPELLEHIWEVTSARDMPPWPTK